jgi:formate hydrogenlyase subunit 3/multisubunit Na+/H+ antiporter MnhD subunit
MSISSYALVAIFKAEGNHRAGFKFLIIIAGGSQRAIRYFVDIPGTAP